MQMKRAIVQWQIEGSMEIEVPVGSTKKQIDSLARATVETQAGPLSVNITRCEVVDIEHDNGGF